ncbi:GUN4 domain-containing protein [Planktothrix sp. FACHB-1355]|uniref:GUN4 domain-containing protein n=1 Tax=Aerosakkonema funiforme FACHB-1375 TaxID=2949571 RepID=A0A926ZL49_9CYAN|nr:GUN4 domain-containing protein [Aerosakkonema funiforme]MBD2186037.1 GUN4 domain-containing protein [Aerosakkonema funiforme FACHB-1375]MBD3558578.1 GUN4 domain-containing protein [Planktothrix sp. FACHB-1355]
MSNQHPFFLPSDVGMDYTHLRDLLAALKWREADEETRLLMLKTVNREKQRNLNRDSIQKFPCTDLCTIDRLWVKYSNGHFGFSVQKQIWLELGGQVNYYTEAQLGDRVGWREMRNWLNYSDLTFSLNAPAGHLPWLGRLGGWLGAFGVWSGCYIAQKSAACNL